MDDAAKPGPFNFIFRFLTGDFPLALELQCFWMAVQGAMNVRKGPNDTNKLNWFHAFCLSTIGGYGGGWMGFLWMGKPR